MSNQKRPVPAIGICDIPHWVYKQAWSYKPLESRRDGVYYLVIEEEYIYLPFFITIQDVPYKFIPVKFDLM